MEQFLKMASLIKGEREGCKEGRRGWMEEGREREEDERVGGITVFTLGTVPARYLGTVPARL